MARRTACRSEKGRTQRELKSAGQDARFFDTMDNMIQKFKTRSVLIRCLIALILSVIYGIVSGPFLLHMIDGLSIASVLFLFAGMLIYWWKEGFFTFFSWKKEDGPLAAHREKVRDERRNIENPTLYAGLLLLAVSLILTLVYYLVF